MKNNLFLMLAILAFFPAFAERTVICGKFANDPPVSVTLQYYATVLDMGERNKTVHRQKINKDASFRFVIDTDRPLSLQMLSDGIGYCGGGNWLFYNKYILPGDSVHFTFSDTAINIEGTAEDYMSFQFEYQQHFNNDDSVKSYNDNWKLPTHLDFAAAMKGRLERHLQYFDSYFKGKDVPELFRKTYRADEEIDFAVNMVQYSWRSKKGGVALNDKAYWAYIKDIDFNSPDYMLVDRYMHLLRELPYGILSAMEKTVDSVAARAINKKQYQLRDSISRVYFKGKVYDYALYNLMLEQVKMLHYQKGTDEFVPYQNKAQKIMEDLAAHMTDKGLYERALEQMRTLNGPRQPAPDFTAHDINDKEVKLSDLKGKVVYIDFWATSCAPCVAELPYIKRMQEHYKNNEDIVMLYVSFDNNGMALQKFLKEKSFAGLHWVDGRSFASEAAEKYKISGIPRYIVVDREGMLVTSDAQRPSENPYAVLNTVLNEGK
ncbi:MAG TPA: TlpA disulfide reductase family protein [Flavipsychrobacter sp.]